eukprot:2511740-Rhodomonas_salina.2
MSCPSASWEAQGAVQTQSLVQVHFRVVPGMRLSTTHVTRRVDGPTRGYGIGSTDLRYGPTG